MPSQLEDQKSSSFKEKQTDGRQKSVSSAPASHAASAQAEQPEHTQAAEQQVQAQKPQSAQHSIDEKKREEAVLAGYTKIQRSLARFCLILFVIVLLVGLFCLLTANTRGLIAVLFCLIVVPCVFYGFKLYVDYTVRRRK